MPKPILTFGCVHIPFELPGYLSFLKKIHRKHSCRDKVVCTGDLTDWHAMSRHITEPDAPSAEEEYQMMLRKVGRLTRTFPKGVLVLGNHDNVPYRQLATLGMTKSVLRDPNKLYGLARGWKVEPLYHVDPQTDVLFEHGIGSGGPLGAINTAVKKRCSYVQSHIHQYGGINYRENHVDKIFGLNVGTLSDESSLALRYAKYSTMKGVKGCGVVYSSQEAYFEPMT